MRLWLEHDGEFLELDLNYEMGFDPNGLTFLDVVRSYVFEMKDGRHRRRLKVQWDERLLQVLS